jgi:hypothetical protein
VISNQQHSIYQERAVYPWQTPKRSLTIAIIVVLSVIVWLNIVKQRDLTVQQSVYQPKNVSSVLNFI